MNPEQFILFGRVMAAWNGEDRNFYLIFVFAGLFVGIVAGFVLGAILV